ncbi:hypothetical protein HK102_005590, partial [Quaeritorhiza haematococci]
MTRNNSHILLAAILVLLLASIMFSSVDAHGYMCAPTRIGSNTPCRVRGAQKISNGVDQLRNPLQLTGQGFCRGESAGTVTDISLVNGQSLTVTMALSVGAQHIGPCRIEILDKNLGNPVQIVSIDGPNGCATPSIVGFNTASGSNAGAVCPNGTPNGLVTNDMCLAYWTFTVQNADRITCTDCVMRWTWDATHISVAAPEKYENCMDVRITNRV